MDEFAGIALCSGTLAIVSFCFALYAAVFGVRALYRSMNYTNPDTWILRSLGMNLCEPLVTFLLIVLTLNSFIDIHPNGVFTPLAMPLATLLISGYALVLRAARPICTVLVSSLLGRWLLNGMILYCVDSGSSQEQSGRVIVAGMLILIGVIALGATVVWAKNEVDGYPAREPREEAARATF